MTNNYPAYTSKTDGLHFSKEDAMERKIFSFDRSEIILRDIERETQLNMEDFEWDNAVKIYENKYNSISYF